MNYWEFVAKNRRFLAFGFLLTWFASFGHTFFISLFSADIRDAFGLTHGGFGTIYTVATVAGGPVLVWLGRKIDYVDLRSYAVLVSVSLIGACFFLAAAPTVLLLGLAIFTLRVAAPILLVHTATIAMARYFNQQRGKAVGFAHLGQSVGEAVLPVTAVALIATLGWRGTWVAIAGVSALFLIPAALWLLKGHGERHRRLIEQVAVETADVRSPVRHWSPAEVVRDARFYLMMPAVMMPYFIYSGLIFHQVHLADSKGWSLAWLATCFIGFAVTKVAAGLLSGLLIDRFGALRVMPYCMLPLGLGLLALAGSNHPAVALAFLAAAGFSIGARVTVVGALWAEVYGVAHLGAIRSVTTAVSFTTSALSPLIFGWMLDFGVSMESIAVMCLALAALATALLALPPVRASPPAAKP